MTKYRNYNQPDAMRRRSNRFDISSNDRRSKEKKSRIVETDLDSYATDDTVKPDERETEQ